MTGISFTNETAYRLPLARWKKELWRWMTPLAKSHQQKRGDVAIAFLTPSSIRKLEKQYFGKDQVTDILTFPADEQTMGGDIGICLHQVFKDARRDGALPEQYLAEIFLHGFLHLCGMEHGYSDRELKKVYQLHDFWMKKLKVDVTGFRLKK